MKLTRLILILGFILPILTNAQGENDNWLFGFNAGVNFGTDGSINTISGSQMNTFEGCSSVSSPTGDLLFYTDGVSVYDRNHNIMPNGAGLLGGISSAQSALIVPWPDNPGFYFLFTSDYRITTVPSVGLNYSIVDMTLNGGNGDITTTKNVNLLGKCEDKIASVVKDCQSGSIWVVTLSDVNGVSRPFTSYHAFEVSPIGVSPTAVVSTFPVINNTGYGMGGNLKFSPDGTKMASSNFENGMYVFDFNAATGIVSNPQGIFPQIPTDPYFYGVEFSPNSRYLYTHGSNNLQQLYGHTASLYQFDLQASNISLSQTVIDPSRPLYRATLQIGRDGKIYRALAETFFDGTPYLGVIHDPDQPGIAANYEHDGVNFSAGLAAQGLPTFVHAFFDTVVVVPDNIFTPVTDYEVCEDTPLILRTVYVPGGTYSWQKDGLPIAGQDGPLMEIASAALTDAGDYTLTITRGQGAATCVITANTTTVIINPIPTTTNNSILSCDNDTTVATDGITDIDLTQFEDSVNFTYLYYETVADRTADNPIADPVNYRNTTAFDQTIYYKATSTSTGCENNDGELLVQVRTGPTVTLDDTFWLCASGPLTLSGPAGLDGYQWYEIVGATETLISSSQDATITTIGNYRLEGSTTHTIGPDTINCTTDEFFEVLAPTITTVDIIPNGTTVTNNFEVCEENILTLEAQDFPGASYAWAKDGVNLGAPDSRTFQIITTVTTDSGDYTVTVTGPGELICPVESTIAILVNPMPSTTSDSILTCDTDALDATDGITVVDLTQFEDTVNFTYSYYESIADRTADNPIADPVNYRNTIAFDQTVYYRATSSATGCENNNGELQVQVRTGPTVTLDDTFWLCPSGPLTLSGPAGLDGYQWFQIVGATEILISSTQDATMTVIGNYRLEGTTNHGTINCTTDEFFELVSPSITAVDIIPNATVASTSFEICEGESLILETQDFAGATYVWAKDGVDLGAPDSRTFEIIASSLTDSGDYTVTITGPGELICPVEGALALIVNPLSPTVNETLLNCDLDTDPTDGFMTMDLTDIEVDPSLTYTYYESIPERDAGNPIADPLSFTNTVPFDQTVYFRTINSSGCEGLGDLELQIRTGPPLDLEPIYWLCLDAPDLTLSGSAGLDGYQWFKIESTGDVSISATQDVTFTEVGNYRLEGSTNFTVGTQIFTCSTNAFFEVVNPSISTVDITPNNTVNTTGIYSICENEVLTLETQIFPGASYVWEKDGLPLGAPNSNTLEINPTSLADAGDYTVTISGPGELQCPITGDLTIIVDDILDVQVVDLLSCDQDTDNAQDGISTIDLTQIEVDPSFTYSYFETLADRDAGNSIVNPESYRNTVAFNQTIYFTSINASGCEGPGEIQVQIRTAPSFSMEASFTICPDNPDLTITGPNGYDSYQWYKLDGDSEQLVSENQNFEVLEAGSYRLDSGIEHSNGTQTINCTSSASFEVLPSNPAIIDAIEVAGYGDDNQVTVVVSGEGDYEYSIDGSNYQDENIFTNLPVGEITFYVQDKNGCGVAEETKDIAEDLSAYGFPKFFTPNGDGINDFWQFRPSPGSFEIDLSSIQIFNRYGNLMAQIGPTSSGWDGRFNGKQVPSTDYWFCAFTLSNQEIRGHFSLKR